MVSINLCQRLLCSLLYTSRMIEDFVQKVGSVVCEGAIFVGVLLITFGALGVIVSWNPEGDLKNRLMNWSLVAVAVGLYTFVVGVEPCREWK